MRLEREHLYRLLTFERAFPKGDQKGRIHLILFFHDTRTEFVRRIDASIVLLAPDSWKWPFRSCQPSFKLFH